MTARSGSAPAPPQPLADRVRDPGFTPSVREIDALVDLLADEDHARAAERAIGRIGAHALAGLRSRLAQAHPPLRGRIVKAVGRLVGDPLATALLVEVLSDADAKSRRNAAIALGRARGSEVEQALVDAWTRESRPDMRSSIAASLGKVGGEKALEILRDAARTDEPKVHLAASRALAMAERTASRSGEAGIDAGRTAPGPVEVVLVARRGLEGVLAEELTSAAGVESVQVDGPGRVRVRLVGPLSSLFAARTWAAVHFPLAGEWTREGERPAEALARAMSSPAAARVLETWTVGAVRYRIAWVDAGHRRAATWDAVQAIAAKARHLVNDPTGSNWQLRVSTAGGALGLSLVPHAIDDPRFSWRRKDVPAASHPTIAAALARIAGARSDDVVWDPFVGSGGELVERARLGPHRALVGTDLEPRALAAARANLAAAGVEARLETRDALTFAPQGATLVITNPPMGRRSARQAGIFDLLDEFVAHVAQVLVPGGRFVWIAPSPERAKAAGERAGLELARRLPIDMGGFEAEIQVWRRAGAGGGANR